MSGSGDEMYPESLLFKKEWTRLTLRIQELIPIDLFTVSDRIGSVIFSCLNKLPSAIYLAMKIQQFVRLFWMSGCKSPRDIRSMHILILTIQGNADTVRVITRENEPAREIVINTSELITVERPEFPWKTAVFQGRYERRMDELTNSREFIRYGKDGSDRERALNDLRALMNARPKTRVCLWDPYLTAGDLLETWYYTDTYGLELRAITSNEIAKKKEISLNDWISEQRDILREGSNQYGINLQWRVQHDLFGFSFHDRFLILLPNGDRPRAWSLGTSINSFGKTHHIFQAVSNPGYIADDFEDLWDRLSDTSCQIWNSREEH